MARVTLTGKMGKGASAAFGADIIAAATLDADSWYLVIGIDALASVLPAGAVVGYLIRAAGTETLVGDDIVKLATFTDKCDIKNWSMEFTKEEIDVTTLCDDQGKVYLPGDTDISGTLGGVYKIGVTDIVGGVQNKFVDMVQASATYAVNTLQEDIMYLMLYTQKAITSGETEQFYLVPASLNSFNQGATRGEDQAFESGFRPSADETNNVKLAYYSYTHA